MPGRRTPPKHVTIVDVARVSGFSPSTVSIVLNEAPLSRYVAAQTKEHIRKTAQTLGYRPNASARSLRSRRSNTIGVMIFDISDPFCTLILRGIERALLPTPYLPIMMDAHNDRRQFEGYLEMLMERRVEGLIVVANWLFEEGGLLGRVRDSSLPTIVVGRDLSASGMRSVIVDNEQGGYLAMQHLHRLGHRKIAVIRGPAGLSDSKRRWEGIQRFAAEHRLTIDPDCVRELPDAQDPASGFEGGIALTEELLRAGAAFTAMVAFDDLTALGAVRAHARAGLRVPQDCSVIGFDDVPPALLSTPGITTIRQPMETMGNLAAEFVLDTILNTAEAGDTSPLVRMLPPSLVLRDSTVAALDVRTEK
ncbi:MAG TPA: LacI family DNA-binding transcriptional regulator [Acidobacteriaceae bacterium]|jgi:LacI family transcriptional regulator|nr:LacI family DNA-binding transcriptional regulator [Acidobacteriaceae bacterium]